MSKNTIISTISFLVVLGLSFWFWNLQKDIVIGGNINSAIIIQSMIVFVLSLVFTAIGLVAGNVSFGVLTALIAPAAIAFYFGFGGAILLSVVGISFVLGVLAYFAAQKEKSTRLKISISSARGGVGIYFFMSLLALTMVFYQFDFQKGELKISESMIKQILPMIEGQIKSQIPFYSSEMKSDEILVMMALAKGGITLDAKTLSAGAQKSLQQTLIKNAGKNPEEVLADPEVQKMILSDIIKNNPKLIAKLRGDFEKQFGVKVEEGQSLASIAVGTVNSYIDKFTAPYKDYVPLVLAISFFFSFKILGFLFVDIALFFSGILFSVLRSAGIIKINKVGAMQEVIEK